VTQRRAELPWKLKCCFCLTIARPAKNQLLALKFWATQLKFSVCAHLLVQGFMAMLQDFITPPLHCRSTLIQLLFHHLTVMLLCPFILYFYATTCHNILWIRCPIIILLRFLCHCTIMMLHCHAPLLPCCSLVCVCVHLCYFKKIQFSFGSLFLGPDHILANGFLRKILTIINFL